jgi:hypothetical protein
MEATPLAQVLVVAVATYWTGELTVAPLAGLVTVTVAKAGAAVVSSARRQERIFTGGGPRKLP